MSSDQPAARQSAGPKIGVIGNRGSWSTESLSQQLQALGAGGNIIEMSELSYDVSSDSVRHGTESLADFDGFVIKKLGRLYSTHLLDDLDILEAMERKGVEFFSSPGNIRKMISRLSCTIRLAENNIPMPPTLITKDISQAVDWIKTMGTCVLKPLYSTKARGMKLLGAQTNNIDELTNFLAGDEQVIYLQQKLDLSGSDYALVFLAGSYIGAYARVGDGSVWHTSTAKGGQYQAFKPDQKMIDLAFKAQQPFSLDFVCVDVAISKEMGTIVFEVSAFGGYKGLIESSGIDAAKLVAELALNRLSQDGSLH